MNYIDYSLYACEYCSDLKKCKCCGKCCGKSVRQKCLGCAKTIFYIFYICEKCSNSEERKN